MDSSFVISKTVFVQHLLWYFGKPVKGSRRVNQVKGSLRKSAIMERTWDTSRVVLPVLREGFEELVEVIGGMIIEENLKLRDLSIQPKLALILEYHSFEYVFNCKKRIRANRATHICNAKGAGT